MHWDGLRSGVGVVLVVLLLMPVVGRIEAEERLLAAQFGSTYDMYRAHQAAYPWHLLKRRVGLTAAMSAFGRLNANFR